LLGVVCGAIAQKIGLHALFGFFLAGVMAGEAKGLSERSRQTIGQMVYAIFVPLFFTGIGLKMDFFKYFDPFLTLFVAGVGIGVRFLGAWLGVSLTKIPKTNRLAIAVAHTPGGMMEIVMGLLALQYNLITPTVFIAIVLGALITAIIMGPWLSWAIAQRKHISVFEFFSRRGIVLPLKVDTKEQAIHILSSVAAQEVKMDEEDIVRAVLARENLMGTAIEEGVALPHARIPGLSKSVVIFGRSLAGVEWNSPDGKPSQFIFLILTPQQDDAAQLQILRAIAQVMLNSKNSQSILNARDAAQTWDTFQAAFAQLYIERK
jgi:mannitol/fructose-specific phosphotransferase system IIA component (Ntr-type)